MHIHVYIHVIGVYVKMGISPGRDIFTRNLGAGSASGPTAAAGSPGCPGCPSPLRQPRGRDPSCFPVAKWDGMILKVSNCCCQKIWNFWLEVVHHCPWLGGQRQGWWASKACVGRPSAKVAMSCVTFAPLWGVPSRSQKMLKASGMRSGGCH